MNSLIDIQIIFSKTQLENEKKNYIPVINERRLFLENFWFAPLIGHDFYKTKLGE